MIDAGNEIARSPVPVGRRPRQVARQGLRLLGLGLVRARLRRAAERAAGLRPADVLGRGRTAASGSRSTRTRATSGWSWRDPLRHVGREGHRVALAERDAPHGRVRRPPSRRSQRIGVRTPCGCAKGADDCGAAAPDLLKEPPMSRFHADDLPVPRPVRCWPRSTLRGSGLGSCSSPASTSTSCSTVACAPSCGSAGGEVAERYLAREALAFACGDPVLRTSRSDRRSGRAPSCVLPLARAELGSGGHAPIPAPRIGDAHGLLRAISERDRLRLDEFVTEFSVDELFHPAWRTPSAGRGSSSPSPGRRGWSRRIAASSS